MLGGSSFTGMRVACSIFWMTTDDDVWWIAEHLVGVPHVRLLTRAMERRLVRVDRRGFAAALVGHRPAYPL